MMDVIREESSREKPRKNIIALLLGTLVNGTSLVANVATILGSAGIIGVFYINLGHNPIWH